MMRRFKVAVAGYYGFGNLGDELLLLSVVKQLEDFGVPRSRILVITASNYDWIDCVNRWNAASVWRAVRQSETLLLGGGGLFQDVTSFRSCLYYWGLIKMACAAGTVPWAVGQSVGPFLGGAGKFLSKSALSSCKVIQVRDELSLQSARELGLDAELGEDLVFTMSGEQSNGKAVLINFRPWQNTENFISAVQKYISECGKEVIGAAMSPSDFKLMRDVQKKYNLNFCDLVLISAGNNFRDLWKNAGEAIGMRLHFSLLSLLFGLKQTLYPYDPKVLSFATRWGIPIWDSSHISPRCASVSLGDINLKVARDFRDCAKKVISI